MSMAFVESPNLVEGGRASLGSEWSDLNKGEYGRGRNKLIRSLTPSSEQIASLGL